MQTRHAVRVVAPAVTRGLQSIAPVTLKRRHVSPTVIRFGPCGGVPQASSNRNGQRLSDVL